MTAFSTQTFSRYEDNQYKICFVPTVSFSQLKEKVTAQLAVDFNAIFYANNKKETKEFAEYLTGSITCISQLHRLERVVQHFIDCMISDIGSATLLFQNHGRHLLKDVDSTSHNSKTTILIRDDLLKKNI